MPEKKIITNKEYANNDRNFIDACVKVGIDATHRQASKFRNKKGLAYKKGLIRKKK